VPLFVDTNLLVYARDSSHRGKHERAGIWMEHLWTSGDGRLSTQVLHEYYVAVTRKLRPSLHRDVARADVEDLMTWNPSPMDGRTLALGLAIEERFGLSFWDSLVVASAQLGGCERLLTEDLHDGAVYDSVTVTNPFSIEPDELRR